MQTVELNELLKNLQKTKCETQTLEIKSAKAGCPQRLYDTLSSFSNQDDGGIILFGVDESDNYAETGVYDAQDLQRRVTEQCQQMTPLVRPVFTVLEQDGRIFVSAEIPGMDVTQRPCFYTGRGRLKGSYTRVGDADMPMTEYEIYSFEAFRKKYQDDVRPVDRAARQSLDTALLEQYLFLLKRNRPNLSGMEQESIEELMSITRNGIPTLASVLLFGIYPQAYFPQLVITAVSVPGTELGETGETGERFIDNRRIEGTLPQMLDGAMLFIRNNIKHTTIIDSNTGKRTDRSEYPLAAVREAVLNALIHRDYSIHTQGIPVRLCLFQDRLEIHSPGGLYGRLRIDQLGRVQPDTRNPALVVAMEILHQTENRYSGIPTMRRELRLAGMPEPEFQDRQGVFTVCFRKQAATATETEPPAGAKSLLEFCGVYRTRQEIADFLCIKTVHYAIKNHVMPLVKDGLVEMEFPDRPHTSKQRYRTRAGKDGPQNTKF